jgi:uncharacterized protein DUF6152
MKRTFLILVVAAAMLSTVATYAHHSVGATYDGKKEIKLEGKLIQFMYRNPHSFVHVEAPDEKGVMQRWAVEWGGASALGGQGVGRTTLKVGDEVVITGNPSRTPTDHRVKMNTLKRPSDGLTWGTRPGEVVD